MKFNLNDAFEDDAVFDSSSTLEDSMAALAPDIVDMMEDEAILDAQMEATDDLLAAESRLQDYADVMNESLESAENGLDATAANALDVAIEDISVRLDIEGYGMPSIEAFESPATRADATTDAIAALEGTMSKIIQGVRNFIAMMFRKAKVMFAKYMANTGKLQQALSDAKAKWGTAKNTAKNKKLKGAGAKAYNRLGGGKTDVVGPSLKLAAEGREAINELRIVSAKGTDGDLGLNVKVKNKVIKEITEREFGITKESRFVGGLKVKVKDGAVSFVKGKMEKVKSEFTGAEVISGITTLAGQGNAIVAQVVASKSALTKLDSAAKDIDAALSKMAGKKGEGKKMKTARNTANLAVKLSMFCTVGVMGMLMKGGWDIVTVINALAGKQTDKFVKSNDGVDHKAAKEDDAFAGDDSFDEFWETI